MRYSQTAYPSAPGGVSSNSAQARGWGSGYPYCQSDKMRTVTLYGGTRVTVHQAIADLVYYLLSYCSLTLRYPIRAGVTGGFNCRAIAGTTVPSNHSWGLAVDVNWDENPMSTTFRSDIPPHMVSIMWAYGFFWGGWYSGTKDPMHFEFVKTPNDVPALTRQARQLWEATMGLEPRDEAMLYNVLSVVGRVAGMYDFAPQRRWNVEPYNTPAADMPLPIIDAVRDIREGVQALIGRPTVPAPVIDYDKLAQALLPHLRTAFAEVLSGATIETDIILPARSG